MKYIDIVRFYKIFLFFLLCACVSPMKAGTITVSSFEYAEIMKNPDAMYVCCDENMSDIKQVVFEISKLDKDKTSPLHLFKRFLRSGFNFVLYDEAVHVLEYAELVVQKKAIEMGNKKIKHVAKKLAVVIQQVLNKELHYDVKQLLSQQRIIEIFPITEDDINTEQRSITIHETIDAKDNVIFKKNIRIHGTLKAYADALFKDKAQFEKTVKFKKNITVKDTVVADSLSVNDAVIQFLEVPGGIVITDVSLDNASITDAVISQLTVLSCVDNLCIDNLTVLGCLDNLCVNNLSTIDIVIDNSVEISSFTSDGVVHNDALGNLSTSLIVDADITNGAITNDKLAEIASADIPNTLVLRDGSGNFITNMITLNGAVTNATDAATKEYVDNAALGLDPKAPARVVATLNQSLTGLSTIDGVSLSANDRVLLVNQSFPIQNGLWLAQSGAWTRPADFASGTMAGQAYVVITSGTVNAGSSWLCDTPTAIIDTDPISFVLFSLPQSTTGANVGIGTGLIFRDKTGNTLNFKSLIAGSNMSISNNTSDITLGVNATSANTPNAIVQRNGSGNFSAGTITANLIGNATSATNFSGSLVGDVTGTQSATVVSFVGGQTAANVASGSSAANAATSANTANRIVKRDGSGNFSAGTITAALNGNATSATNFSGSLSGDVTGTQSATVVSFVGGQTAANVASGSSAANAATSANTANTIVKRNASGNFSAGTITATLNGTATFAGSFTGSLSGDVTGTQNATVVSFVAGQTAANVGAATALANASTSSNTANTIVKRDGSGNFSAGTITANLVGNSTGFTGSLAGDVTGTQGATVVSFVGGQSAANVATAASLASTATSSNTPNTLVLRSGSGNFSAGIITATLNGNAATATTATNATNFTGSLSGDVTGTQSATVVSFVGGQSAANVASATTAANAATNLNTANTIVKRDGSGNFFAGTITGNLSGTATNFSGALLGDVTGTQSATIVSLVGGQSAANVASATTAANAATSSNVANTIVKRDGSGNFSAGTITANLSGTAVNFSGSLSGDVTGVQSATIVSFVGGQTAANVASGAVLANAATNLDTASAIVRRDGSGNFAAQTITADTGVTFTNGGSTVNYYLTGFGATTFNANTGSPATLTPNVVYTRIGNIVTVTIASQSFTASGSPQYYTASAAIPSALRPTNGQVQTAFAPIVSGAYVATDMGTVTINSSGDIVVKKQADGGSSWANAANQGWDSLSVSYCV